MHLLLIIGALFWLAPLLLALMNSFKTNGELLTNVLSLPQSLSFENYARTLDKMHYFRSLGNTVLLSQAAPGRTKRHTPRRLSAGDRLSLRYANTLFSRSSHLH